jgi:hypothetical protein
VVELEHSAQALPALDRPIARERVGSVLREEEQIVFPLMGSFMVVMLDVLGDGVMEGSLAEEDHAVERLISTIFAL